MTNGRPITEEERVRFRAMIEYERELKTQTDRGAAIIAFCDMEDTLEHVIRSQLRDDKEQKGQTVQDRMFKGAGPLATFVAKCRLAFLIGMIDKTYLDELRILAAIRNNFAHQSAPIYFHTQSFTDRCNNLEVPKLFGQPITIDGQEMDLCPTPRDQYVFCCKHISQSLVAMARFHAMKEKGRRTVDRAWLTFPA